ncbi:MAG: hypothetical protein HPY66_1424 [Firmicutes bacterium]|nr:hypothetical protein [Bacillota bacterium]
MNISKYRWIKVLLLVSAVIIIFVLQIGLQKSPKTSQYNERINYKILDEAGKPSFYTITSIDKVKLFLQITPFLEKERPVLYTIFMNGKQIECKWNNELSLFHRRIIYPGKSETLEIIIEDIPEGLNTFHFGEVYYPDKTDWNDKDNRFNWEYSLNLSPFSVVSGKSSSWSEETKFFHHDGLLFNASGKKTTAGIHGSLSMEKDRISYSHVYDIKEINKLYYHWKNSDVEPRRVRLSLLRDWQQIPWPDSGELFIDILANPDDMLIKEIDISKLAKDKENQLTIIAFLNPDVSFWYFDDKSNDLEANHYGAIAFATLRDKIFK